MLKITNLLGQSLELNKNTVIAVEKNNTLFSTDDTFVQDITYPGSAGLTENNLQFISQGHLVEARSDVYEFPVQVFVADYQFYTAIFSYKIVKNQIEYLLKVNFGALVSKMKNALLQDIFTLDGIEMPNTGRAAAYRTLMLQSCLHPADYPFSFFPVKNENWHTVSTSGIFGEWINEWDFENQRFKGFSELDAFLDATAPFFKLSYILEKIFTYLNLKVTGEYFNTDAFDEIYIYTRRGVLYGNVEGCMAYMPKLTINEFLKQIKERLKVSFDFDLMNGVVNIVTSGSIITSEPIDIIAYIERLEEISTPEKKGYKVSLKVEESDLQTNIGTIDNPIYESPFNLVIGDGQNLVELEVGTLTEVTENGYTYPIADQPINGLIDSNGIDDWQVRLLIYKGMKNVSAGKVFPEARAMNLEASDADFYRFMNDSKKVIISAKIPPSVLGKMKASSKLSCKSNKGTFFYAIPEKIEYSMSNRITELVAVRITARTVVSNYKTKFYIDDNQPGDVENPFIWKYKAFWDPEIHGFTELRVQAFSINGAIDTFGYTPIEMPTDDGGVGGTMGTIYRINTGDRADRNEEIRVYSPVAPKYYVKDGIKGYFTKSNNYYIFQGDAKPGFSNRHIWIVF